MTRATLLALITLPALAACSSEPPPGLPVLGYAEEDGVDRVLVEVVARSSEGLNRPRDLDIDPETGNLWVVNQADDSVTILFEPGSPGQSHEHLIDPYALHFMEEVSSISFGQPGTFGTCQESRNTYNDRAAGNDFMGPALWSSDLDIFARSNPEAVDYLTELFGAPTDLGSHLDMQHETPLCTGIAWERDNVYWTYDGLNETIDRVDFGADHGPGYDDHSDGITAEYVRGEIGYVEDVSNHMEFDAATGFLYIADTAGGRVMRLDTTTGTRGSDLPVTEPGTEHYTMDGADITPVVGPGAGLDTPSGLALVNDVLFVSDFGTGIIHAFDVLTGMEIDRYDTGRGPDTIQGLIAPSEDEIWFVDTSADQLIRVLPAPTLE